MHFVILHLDMETTLDTIKDICIRQRRDGYRFSMDAVFLASFVNARAPGRIADFGAGSGVVGLMLARRYPGAEVTLVELQEGLYALCKENISANGLEGRVKALCADIRKLGGEFEGLDLVVSNPPFRKPLSGRISQGREKAVARHELELTLPELVQSASRSLKPRGRFLMVYLPERLADVVAHCRGAGLEPKRLRFVHGRQGAEARMVLIEAVKQAKAALKVEPPLLVYEGRGQTYTAEVQAMYGETS
ncbi:MAG: tRNA1(Val) (adenine(37)-N6)-methyltransferase [Thermodesulfovibrionales bacterium]|nr:tRNA1(Val) (adenine(37)-N6)-methyltransferase [Thermodesulfovibrionales bacterium]